MDRFAQVPQADIERSSFDLSHNVKTTFDADYLVPFPPIDCVPGDTFNINANWFVRLATPLFPTMDTAYIDLFAFFVPYRLLWDNFPKFLGSREDPGDSIDYTIPVISGTTAVTVGSQLDYMGLPIGLQPDDTAISSLPIRAYRFIFNEWFRDQNLQNTRDFLTNDGPDADSSYVGLQKRGKRHDYFTSCLPWPQKGDAVNLPLGTEAPIFTKTADLGTDIEIGIDAGDNTDWAKLNHNVGSYVQMANAGSGDINLWADLSNAEAPTINAIRLAFQTQRLLERDARSGTRMVELIKSHFGVTVPDFRLQRPEFLGSGTGIVNVAPVPQTTYQGTATNEDAKGSLAGYGTCSGSMSATYSVVEHGLIMFLANARAEMHYHQGVDRYWTKDTRYDYYWPVLARIGEQAVRNDEIYYQGTSADEDVFGYQERYAELRYIPNRLTGLHRPGVSGSLAVWNYAEDFSSLPTLGQTFITGNAAEGIERSIAVSTEPHFIGDFRFGIKAARPLPLWGIPGNLDHF